MGKATVAKQRAIGLIGGGDVRTLENNGISVVYTAELDQLAARLAELERDAATLRAIVADTTRINVEMMRHLGEVMG